MQPFHCNNLVVIRTQSAGEEWCEKQDNETFGIKIKILLYFCELV